ncbi:hypothetical protein [Blastopirellula retiformator]|nr:hypothetical protein [Blastopirellula retiformator]
MTLYGEEQDKWKQEQIGEAIWKIDADAAQQARIKPPEKEDQ